MEYESFGKTGVRVSKLCLGTMTFGNEADEKESVAIMDRAFDGGVNFFDTADVYNRGTTEEIVGRWLGARRDEIVLATKVHFPTGKGVNERGSTRLHIVKGVEKSLRRLQTDYVDVLYLHHWDEETALEESLGALTHLVNQGKVLYCAVSNFSAWQTVEAVCTAEKHGFAPVAAIQPMYNLVKRQAESEILPMAQAKGLAVCPYSPMGAGLLTGKYQRNESGRIAINAMYKERYKNPEYREVSDRFVAYAQSKGLSPAALSVAWVARHPAVTSPIVGMRNLEQLELALGSLDIPLDEAMRKEITELSIEPPLPTDREKSHFVPVPTPVPARGNKSGK